MTISSIQQIIQNLSEEELNTEILLSTYFQGTSTTASSENVFDGDENLASGEILPWGVKALWKGEDYSQTDEGENNNFGGEFDENGDFQGSYAFVIDSGVSETTNDLNLSPDVDDGGWSKSFVGSEPTPLTTAMVMAATSPEPLQQKSMARVSSELLREPATSLKVFNASGGGQAMQLF